MNKKYTLLFKMKVLNIYISLHKYIHRGYKDIADRGRAAHCVPPPKASFNLKNDLQYRINSVYYYDSYIYV